MKLLQLIRSILRLPAATVTKAEAIEIARQAAVQNGFPWREPIFVEVGLVRYSIWTDTDRAGGNVSVDIRVSDGAVLQIGMLPR